MVWRVVTRIESETAIDRWSERVRPLVSTAIGAGKRRDLLTGRWIGHSFHPAAVLAPLGAWTGAAIVDVVGGPDADRIARRLLGIGVLSAAPALASGAAEWLDTRQAEQRVGTAHAVLNNVATVAMGASWALRRRGHRTAGIVASSIGLASVGAAGMLGGHLAYARGVAVSTTAFQAGPEDWTRLVSTDRLRDGEPVSADLDGVGYVVVADSGRIHVLENRCTHRGGPLADGVVVDGCVECPWHASRFRLDDGSVRSGPAAVDQPAYESRVVDDQVEIRRTELGGLRRSAVRPSG